VDPRARFVDVVSRADEVLPLDEAAILMAARGRPPVDVEGELRRLDELATRVGEPTVDRLMETLFVEEGFRGDVETYGDPRNSFLPDVLDRRMGIPITLSVLAIEVGRRVGITLRGVGMPGHFLVRSDGAGAPRFLDPFAGGVTLDEEACAARFRAAVGPVATWDSAFLAPVGPRQIIARMLANLRQHYLMVGDAESLAWVVQWRVAIPGVDPGEVGAVAEALVRQGRIAEAAIVLEGNDRVVDARRVRARLN
jgi:regulator of sirC expression with transglutaminase-like and TPR domain